jgi:hypothetical protein
LEGAGSLLVFREDVYKRHLHAIEERLVDTLDDSVANLHLLDVPRQSDVGSDGHSVEVDRERTRVSLTIRIVKKLIA